MKTTMAMTMMAIAVTGALLPVVTFGQQAEGIRPLTPDRVPEVVAVGQEDYKVFYSDLFLLRLKARTDGKAPQEGPSFSDGPWGVTITTPFLRGADVVWTAKRKFQPEPKLDLAALNRDQIAVFVASRKITSTNAIESMVIKRGTTVVQALKAVPGKVAAQNGFGATGTVAIASFMFPFETFAPTEDIVMVLIGTERNFEYPMSAGELAMMK